MEHSKIDITAEDSNYLAKHNVHHYVEDAVGQLLAYREEHTKVIPSKFLADYFRSVHEGSNTLYREYSYISSTSHNRACFINNVWGCFHHIATHGELLSVKEYHSLLCLICRDFPLAMVQRAARIVLMDDALDCLMSFVDFLYAFQIQLYYEDYINLCKEPYDHLLTGSTTVFVPSSDNWQHSKYCSSNHEEAGTKHNEGVNSQSFFDALEKIDAKLGTAVCRPKLIHIRSELDKVSRITFHGLLMALSKNEQINSEIGALPRRDELISGYDVTAR